MRVYLDMDGVCCDWVGGVLKLFKKPTSLLKTWPKGLYDVAQVIGVTEDELWRRLDDTGEDLWAGLAEYPWFRVLYSRLTKLTSSEPYFLTSPSKHITSLAGKQRWLRDRFGQFFDRVIFTRHKALLADDNTFLVDDDTRNVKAFKEAGGSALLFPQPWNEAKPVQDPVGYVIANVTKEM